MTSRSPDSAKDLRVVTFHFRGLMKNGVSLYGLSDPEVRQGSRLTLFPTRFGIPTDLPATQPKPCDASHAVTPTTRHNPTGPADSSSAVTPSGTTGLPASSEEETFQLAARVATHPPKRTRDASKGEPSSSGLHSNSRGVLRPFGA
jgi:hypothetical protein